MNKLKINKTQFLKKIFLGSIALTEVFFFKASAGRKKVIVSELEKESKNGLEQVQKAEVLEKKNPQEKANERHAPKSSKEMLERENLYLLPNQIPKSDVKFDEFLHDPKRSYEEKEAQLIKDYRNILSFYFKKHFDTIKKQKDANIIIEQFEKDCGRMFQRFLDNGEKKEAVVINIKNIHKRLETDENRANPLLNDMSSIAIQFLHTHLEMNIQKNDKPLPIDPKDKELKKNQLFKEGNMLGFKYFIDLSGENLWRNLKNPPVFLLQNFTQELAQIYQRYFEGVQKSTELTRTEMHEIFQKAQDNNETRKIHRLMKYILHDAGEKKYFH